MWGLRQNVNVHIKLRIWERATLCSNSIVSIIIKTTSDSSPLTCHHSTVDPNRWNKDTSNLIYIFCWRSHLHTHTYKITHEFRTPIYRTKCHSPMVSGLGKWLNPRASCSILTASMCTVGTVVKRTVAGGVKSLVPCDDCLDTGDGDPNLCIRLVVMVTEGRWVCLRSSSLCFSCSFLLHKNTMGPWKMTMCVHASNMRLLNLRKRTTSLYIYEG